MTLKEKFKDIVSDSITYKQQYDSFEKIADDYVIEFANWFAGRYTEAFFYEENYTDNLLKEFKKEKGWI